MDSKIASENLIGREFEKSQIRACLKAQRNVLLEGPVGVGKTQLALSISQEFQKAIFRVDGDQRYSEQKMTGWFDPPTVIQKGFVQEAFLAGPLVEAMQKGGILFINELNRLPDGVQNVLLPAIDERVLFIPRLGLVSAQEGFLVIATQNPKEFVATSHLSEALLDRFEWIVLDYQSYEEEFEIVQKQLALKAKLPADQMKKLAQAAVHLIRMTRNHAQLRRGASIRAAMSLVSIAAVMIQGGQSLEQAFIAAALLALPTRVELEREMNLEDPSGIKPLLEAWAKEALLQLETRSEKKKN